MTHPLRHACRTAGPSRRTFAACTLLMVAAGCGGATDPIACTDDFRYGLNIEVVQAGTRAVIDDASGTATEGSYTEDLMAFSPGTLVGAGERPGTYAVTITAPDHEDWNMAGIELGFDGCHVIPVSLEAELTPTG